MSKQIQKTAAVVKQAKSEPYGRAIIPGVHKAQLAMEAVSRVLSGVDAMLGLHRDEYGSGYVLDHEARYAIHLTLEAAQEELAEAIGHAASAIRFTELTVPGFVTEDSVRVFKYISTLPLSLQATYARSMPKVLSQETAQIA